MSDLFSPNLARAQENQEEALRRIEAHYAGFLLAMREEARKVVRRAGQVTTDDLRTLAKIKGVDDVDPHAWGAIFKEVDEAGRPAWRAVARQKSTLAANNGRLIAVWVLR